MVLQKQLFAIYSIMALFSVEIFTRDVEKAKKQFILKGYDISFKTYGSLNLSERVLINTTPIGMYPKVDDCPINKSDLSGCKAVVDLIYNPTQTLLTRYADEINIQTVNGFICLCPKG